MRMLASMCGETRPAVVGSFLLAAIILATGGCTAHVEAGARQAPAPAPAPPQVTTPHHAARPATNTLKAPAALLGYTPATGVVRCRATGTELTLPAPLRARARRGDDGTLISERADHRLAVLVRATMSGDLVKGFFADWKRLHEALGTDLPANVTVDAKARTQRGNLVVDYKVLSGHVAPHFELAYALVVGNGTSCHLAVLQAVPAGAKPDAAKVLDGIRDSGSVDANGAPGAPRSRDQDWSALKLLLGAGSLVIGK